MDPQLYKNEIDRLSKEISTLKETTDCPTTNIWAYKYYFLIVLIMGFILYLIQPKYILMIDTDDEEDPKIIISTKAFFICWIISSIISCIAYYIFGKYKKE